MPPPLNERTTVAVCVAAYLAAIVAANLLAATYGATVTIVNAFVFIGLDLVTRDALHELWRTHRWVKLLALITCGSLVAWAIQPDAGRIGVASAVAIAAAGLVDTAGYHLLRRRTRLVRMNGSNIPAAIVDSVVFPTLAFGAFLPAIVVGQAAAKIFGGFVWSLAIAAVLRRRITAGGAA